ncbi:putative membrane protein [Propionispora sp. 2/2-37]|uniref:DMT family transporter n=1 Tax=Propionispora sp. 2/2-37 TaxID=1677858 RepID=UPI0006BB7617|nr:DMT family transporter [Propionispora sp. 2/2-37]CUH95916.1 putative membrane protein [Propionispora sp. 2/2-37]
MLDRKHAVIYLALTAIFWSTGGVMIKWVTWNPMAVAGMRSLIAALVIWFAFRHDKLSFTRAQWGGAIAYCATVSLFVIATKLTTAANAILLQYTAPVYIALLGGLLLGEKATRKDWLTIILVFGGMTFFFADKVTAGGMLGNLCAVASGLTFAFISIFMRMQKNEAPYGSVLLGNILTFVISIPFLQGVAIDYPNVGAILFLGVFQLGLAYVLYTHAIKHVKALDAVLITTLEPILNPVWVFFFIGEVPGLYALIGGLIVVGSIVMRSYLEKQEPDVAITGNEKLCNQSK